MKMITKFGWCESFKEFLLYGADVETFISLGYYRFTINGNQIQKRKMFRENNANS